ncbi:glucosyl transferase [Phytohalomonas tamaricis]|uniref:glucosyl transferase n=1 Tax=Phytohalomonas tamaricis TaxID=2081032 RepID=UPI000D0B4622|nr:glucosyl transferase [Phytohalomonas tamaricis]
MFGTHNKMLVGWSFLFLALFAVIVSRRADIIFNAQPWAEDGNIWLAQIYNNGFWNSVIHPQNGYYQTVSRLAYGIGILFGVGNAPLVANIIAISLRCAFVMFILSSRMNNIPLKYRLVAAFYFLVMPNLGEAYVNITNAHWYLAVYLLAVILCEDAANKYWKTHDFAVLFLSGTSGPFVIFLAPCLIIKRIAQRGGFVNAIKRINLFDLVMAALCFVQLIAVLSISDSDRVSAPLGASVGLLVEIFSAKIFASTFAEAHDAVGILRTPLFAWLLFLLVTGGVIYFTFKSEWRFKAAVIFPIVMIGFALSKPMVTPSEPLTLWEIMLIPLAGQRYFFITNFAFFCFLLYAVHKIGVKTNLMLAVLVLGLIPTLHKDFFIPPLPYISFYEDIERFNKAETGEVVRIAITPPRWFMVLEKK